LRFGKDRKLFLVSDGMADDACRDSAKRYPGRVIGFFMLDSIPEYKTNGFGCIEQTDPFMAYLYGLKRDDTCFIPRYLVLKTEKAVNRKLVK